MFLCSLNALCRLIVLALFLAGLSVDKLPAKPHPVSAKDIPEATKKFPPLDVNISNSGISGSAPMSELRDALAKVLANQNSAAGSSGTKLPHKSVNTPPLKRTPSKSDNLKTIFPVYESGMSKSKPVKMQGMSAFPYKK